jgi:hypothetical protein
MREIFNSGRYFERLQSCEFTAIILEERPASPGANEPAYTRSRMLSYRDRATDNELARVHQYDRPDGKIGASGRPDPKRLIRDGVMFRLRQGGA